MISYAKYREQNPATQHMDRFTENLKAAKSGVYTETIKGRPNEVQSRLSCERRYGTEKEECKGYYEST